MAEAISELVADADSALVETRYVLIYAPKRTRSRFPEGCVTVCASEAEARSAAQPAADRHAAVASGPSRSSEGFRLYYLVRWLG